MRAKTITVTTLSLLASLMASSNAEARDGKDKRVAARAAAPAPTSEIAPAPAAAPPPAAAAAAPAPAPAAGPTSADRPEAAEADDGPPPDGFSIGARVGYALPMGSIAKDASLKGATDLSRSAAGMVPVWADVGYRVNPRWYIGGYFQLGLINTAGDVCKRTAGANDSCSSSGTDIRFGALARYTFKPGARLTPWLGVSTGYEITTVSVSAAQNTTDNTVKGWEFIGLHVGADFQAAPALSLGPVLMASFGQYGEKSWSQTNDSGSSDFTNTALHQWVFFGLRGQYDL